MDTVALETKAEWTAVRAAIAGSPDKPTGPTPPTRLTEDNAVRVWTSGRLCDFDGCENSEHVKPVPVKGWFWSSNNMKMVDVTCSKRECFHE